MGDIKRRCVCGGGGNITQFGIDESTYIIATKNMFYNTKVSCYYKKSFPFCIKIWLCYFFLLPLPPILQGGVWFCTKSPDRQ